MKNHDSTQITESDSPARLRVLAVLVGILFATFLGWAVGEVYVRITRPHVDIDAVRSESLEYEPTLFSRHAFPQKGQVKGEGTINERGYRGHSFQVPKPTGVVRVVMLGGSSTYDPYAVGDQDWPHLAEAKLHASGFPQVEVINAGTPGHATWDSLGRLYSEIWMFQPDYVLICHGWNDITYFRWLNPDKSLLRGYRPLSTVPSSQTILVDNPFMYYRGTLDRILSQSQLYAHLRWRYWQWHFGLLGSEGLFLLGGRTPPPEAVIADTYPEWGPRQYELDLRLLVDAIRDIGATPILLTQPRLLSPPTSQIKEKRIPYGTVGLSASALARAFVDVDRAVRLVGEEKHVAVLDLAKMFNENSELFVRHVHLSPAGSDTVGAAVAEFLAPIMSASATAAGVKHDSANRTSMSNARARNYIVDGPAKPGQPELRR